MKDLKRKNLTAKERHITLRLKKRLESITPIRRMVIFGSRARGDDDPESDMDIFLEVPTLDADLRRKISEVAWEIGLDEGLVISTFVATTHAIHSSPLAANPILRAIETEGIVI